MIFSNLLGCYIVCMAGNIKTTDPSGANKSTVDEIRAHFDQHVERFSNLQSGQQTMVDARLILDLVAASARGVLVPGMSLLDIGCGAGNFTINVLQQVPGLHCHLVDLSQAMLERAVARVRDSGAASVATYQSDLRTLSFGENSFDCILAGAALHHLRDDQDWHATFTNIKRWLKPGGRLYVADFIVFDLPDVQEVMWQRYGDYLASLNGTDFRDRIFSQIAREDSPRSLPFQLDLLKSVGFSKYDVLHRNSVFGCYVALK